MNDDDYAFLDRLAVGLALIVVAAALFLLL